MVLQAIVECPVLGSWQCITIFTCSDDITVPRPNLPRPDHPFNMQNSWIDCILQPHQADVSTLKKESMAYAIAMPASCLTTEDSLYEYQRLLMLIGLAKKVTWKKMEYSFQGCRRVKHSFKMQPSAYTSTLHSHPNYQTQCPVQQE